MILTFRPLKQRPEGWDVWPKRTTPFRAPYSDTLDLLDRELSNLGASEPILQVDAEPGDVRIDGQLRANAKVHYPGVILSFETKQFGTLAYTCNAYDGWGGRPGWQANLRAITLGLEALRKVERYGIANRGQQYAGWAELPSGIPMGQAMTYEEAVDLLRDAAGYNGCALPPVPSASELFRQASKRHHPDVGGDPEMFRKLVEARDLIEGTK